MVTMDRFGTSFERWNFGVVEFWADMDRGLSATEILAGGAEPARLEADISQAPIIIMTHLRFHINPSQGLDPGIANALSIF
jgi:hypothetical protein